MLLIYVFQPPLPRLTPRSTYWPTMRTDVKKFLKDCPDCELAKARQTEATSLFAARPHDAPRSRWAMDFQGQGLAVTGETQALGLIDTTARFAVVIPLPDREASTLVGPYLDRIVFQHGSPEILHSDAAQEFLSELMKLVSEATDTHTTTTLGHNARGNSTIEVFWRCWNRCMRILPDDHYRRWPEFAARIVYAYNIAPHESLGGISPYEMYHGVAARDPFSTAVHALALDAQLPAEDLDNPTAFAAVIRTSTAAFCRLAQVHSDYVRITTAARLNAQGTPRSYAVGEKVKIRVPPTHEQILATGRRSSHIAAWRGPCTIVTRMSSTTYAMTEDASSRRFERAATNILPYRATSSSTPSTFDPFYSDPFTVNEMIAVRDEPGSMYFVAKTIGISDKDITVHYFGSTTRDTAKAIFRPCFHLPATHPLFDESGDITLATTQPTDQVPYTGILELDSLRDLIVARNLVFTAAHRLRRKSQKVLHPVHEELFIFEK